MEIKTHKPQVVLSSDILYHVTNTHLKVSKFGKGLADLV